VHSPGNPVPPATRCIEGADGAGRRPRRPAAAVGKRLGLPDLPRSVCQALASQPMDEFVQPPGRYLARQIVCGGKHHSTNLGRPHPSRELGLQCGSNCEQAALLRRPDGGELDGCSICTPSCCLRTGPLHLAKT